MDDVLSIIREYSRPLTRGDWRRLHKYTNDKFQEDLVVLNYNLYVNVYNNKRNGGYLLHHKFKYLHEHNKLLYYSGLWYSVVDVNSLVVVLQHGNKKIYCLYKTDALELDGYIYQDVDQIIYVLAEFKMRHYLAEKLILAFCMLYYSYLLYNMI